MDEHEDDLAPEVEEGAEMEIESYPADDEDAEVRDEPLGDEEGRGAGEDPDDDDGDSI